jgi:UPF0716 protein FxsA
MQSFPLLLILILSIPLIEIWIMIDIGSIIGAGWTIMAIIATAVIGASVVRFQGFGVYSRMQSSVNRGEVPAMEMIEGLSLFISGVLLLTPGFVTDALGFLILVPPLRRWFALNMLKRFFIVPMPGGPPADDGSRQPGGKRKSIEGEYRRMDD